MKRRLKEETIIFISVFKWIALATIIGIIVGVSTTVFVSSLNWGSRLVSQYPYYFLLMPACLLARSSWNTSFRGGHGKR